MNIANYSCPNMTPAATRTEHAVRDWLATQINVLAYWRELLLATGDETGLVELLDDHEAFLRGAAAASEALPVSHQ
ncbi:hypothetical protein [Maricaulis sp.]|uniref:hypothetical protein n=1 Tax=unclassified Maricaulis TaxID=2632371 RepID=UPI001B02601C|nr:hypothetical protein [Maricaulis sp.]MBO6797742.1 hypothetical protein [Maricaulis sp.]